MRGMFDQIAAQAKDANKTADFLETIVNMKMLYYLEHKENKILLDIIAKLMEDRKSSPEKVITFFDKLRAHSKEYMKHLNDKAPCQAY